MEFPFIPQMAKKMGFHLYLALAKGYRISSAGADFSIFNPLKLNVEGAKSQVK
jgi:hypothetical protein